ncbi:GvpL/GvpF family gas vesicle protein [Acidobacteria bacterium AH-259-A15]|nr:GvpL/GvpF family gas vesicle protein [Acidobacteria bacterium AH-259-A15]
MSTGRYLYCIVPGAHRINFGPIGIHDSDVFSISHNNLSVIVHECDAKPYDSKDEEVVAKWVLSHEKVIELAMDKFGAVLPFRFNTIIEAADEQEVDNHMSNWLTEDQGTIKEKLEKVRGKAEYGVQISWDIESISNEIIREDTEFQSLAKEIEKMSEGLAYMNRHKLESLLKKRLEKKADAYFKRFYSAIKGCVDGVKVEKVKKEPEPRQMIMNLSCLVSEDARALAKELEKIEKREGFFVRFTGPWPPYSFVEG